MGYQLKQADGGYYMAYNVVAITAAKDTFIEWESVLTECMKTLDYSESFVNATNQASNEKVALSKQISQNFNQTMDGFMSSWESRNKSQDIMSQKQSDATLGYERVYDTETHEVYKATNGFTDVYDGKRYKPVTDDDGNTSYVDSDDDGTTDTDEDDEIRVLKRRKLIKKGKNTILGLSPVVFFIILGAVILVAAGTAVFIIILIKKKRKKTNRTA